HGLAETRDPPGGRRGATARRLGRQPRGLQPVGHGPAVRRFCRPVRQLLHPGPSPPGGAAGARAEDMKTALPSVSYAGVWPGQARLTLDSFLERAHALGFDAVMLMAKRPHLSPLDYDADARRRLRGQLDRLGLAVACLAGYTDFCMGSDRP